MTTFCCSGDKQPTNNQKDSVTKFGTVHLWLVVGERKICGVGASYLELIALTSWTLGCGWLGSSATTPPAIEQAGNRGSGGVLCHSSTERLWGRRWAGPRPLHQSGSSPAWRTTWTEPSIYEVCCGDSLKHTQQWSNHIRECEHRPPPEGLYQWGYHVYFMKEILIFILPYRDLLKKVESF